MLSEVFDPHAQYEYVGFHDFDEELIHVSCDCKPELAYCGTPIEPDDTIDDSTETSCVVCAAMENTFCPYCGEDYTYG